MRSTAINLFTGVVMPVIASGLASRVLAQEGDSDLAKKLSNPVAAMISVPLQFNYDSGFGPDDGYRAYLNVQPVIPISINEDWNLISRTIVPIIRQNDIARPSSTQFGMSDVTQSFFFSPSDPGPTGIIWGVGPVFLLPTATDDMLGSEKFGVGPTAVVLKQIGGWTVGVLGNHVWSVAGDDARPISVRAFCNPSSRTPPRRHGRSRSTPKARTIGRMTNGRCRSTSWFPNW